MKKQQAAWILAALFLLLSVSACASEGRGIRIVSIDASGVMTVADAAGTTYTLQPYEEKAPPVYSGPRRTDAVDVKAYGAAGDGITDDTSAIRAAIDGLAAGGVLYFPAGTYRITDTIRITSSGLIIEGEGNGTVLLCDIGAADAAGALVFDDGASGITVRRLSLSYGSGAETLCGIRIGACGNLTVSDVDVTGFPVSGIHVSAAGDAYAAHISVNGCILSENGGSGLSAGQVEELKITACDLSGNGFAGISAGSDGQPKRVIVSDNTMRGNGTAGVSMAAGEDIEVMRNSVRGNGGYGIYVCGDTVEHVIVSGNTVSDMTGDTVQSAVAVGTTAAPGETRGTFIVSGNTVSGFSAASAPGYVLTVNGNTTAVVSDNRLDAETVSTGLLVMQNDSAGKIETNLSVSENRFTAAETTGAGITVCAAEVLHIMQNVLTLDVCKGASCIAVDDATEILFCELNTVTEGSGAAGVPDQASELWSVKMNAVNGK